MENEYSCLIVDDEKPAHEVLKAHMSQVDNLRYKASAFNGKEALLMLQSQDFDIVFLDIEMPLINGIELLQSLNPKPAVIITTAFQEFAFEAWQSDAVDYLQKPISYAKFLKAVTKAKNYCSVKDRQFVKKSFAFRINGVMLSANSEDIIYISSLGNYLKIFTTTHKNPLLVYESLTNIQQQLSKDTFIQIHRSYIVNKVFISKIDKETLRLKNGEQLAIGRKYQILLEGL